MSILTKSLVSLVFCFSLIFASTLHAGPPGRPFAELQDQIDDLRALLEPVEIEVDCAAGETVTAALASVEGSRAPLTIKINGICTESVFITRDGDTTIKGSSTLDGLLAPVACTGAVINVIGAQVTLDTLSIDGGGIGVNVAGASTALVINAEIRNYCFAGLNAVGIASLTNSLVTAGTGDGFVGVSSAANGNIGISNTVIQNNIVGVRAINGGVLGLLNGTVVQDNTTVGASVVGGSLIMAGALIHDNGSGGVLVTAGGTLNMATFTPTDINVIRDNSNHGLFIGETSSATFAGINDTIIDNSGWGIACEVGSNYNPSDLNPGGKGPGPDNVSGNGEGQIQLTCD